MTTACRHGMAVCDHCASVYKQKIKDLEFVLELTYGFFQELQTADPVHIQEWLARAKTILPQKGVSDGKGSEKQRCDQSTCGVCDCGIQEKPGQVGAVHNQSSTESIGQIHFASGSARVDTGQ